MNTRSRADSNGIGDELYRRDWESAVDTARTNRASFTYEECSMRKRALLIGINKYRIAGADLLGCVNDVQRLSAVLTELYEFDPDDIALLTDGAATKKAIMAGVKGIVRESKQGDVAVIHYSGHGSNIPDNNGDEADSRDEILCPTDLDWEDPLRDDWLRITLDGVRAGVSLTVLMDCCHSGTATRAILPPEAPKPRYLPSPWDLIATESGREVRGRIRSQLRRTGVSRARTRDVAVVETPEVLINACRNTQIATDALIGGEYHGAFTHALVEATKAAKGDLTYRQLSEHTTKLLRDRHVDQSPQLFGQRKRLDQRLFTAA
jgi:hypothetical protein